MCNFSLILGILVHICTNSKRTVKITYNNLIYTHAYIVEVLGSAISIVT